MPRKMKALPSPSLAEPLTAHLLGQVIRARRTQLGLRIDTAAGLCGVAKETLMKLEHGHTSTHLDKLLQICQALGIQLRVLPWNIEESTDDWH